MAHAIPPDSVVNVPGEPARSSPSSSSRSLHALVGRGLTLLAMLALLTFVAYEGGILYKEWATLQTELAQTRSTAVVGYPGIQPNMSYAQYPSDWFRQEGNQTLLWGGWRDGVGHLWFRVGRGEVDRAWISIPRGRDIQRAIDRPLVETGGGTFWGRVPDDATVIGDRIGGIETAYPAILLDKVAIVNDVIQEQPFLVTYNSYAPSDEDRVAVYEAILAGHRVTMGLTGYSHGNALVFYDRGTESLWVPESGALRAFAGPHKGSELRLIARPNPVSWIRWRSSHPHSRLVVGADRTVPRPEL
jgi:Protein of unknown function (DUF3179)